MSVFIRFQVSQNEHMIGAHEKSKKKDKKLSTASKGGSYSLTQ